MRMEYAPEGRLSMLIVLTELGLGLWMSSRRLWADSSRQ
jgi:hypothetical protein